MINFRKVLQTVFNKVGGEADYICEESVSECCAKLQAPACNEKCIKRGEKSGHLRFLLMQVSIL